MKKMIFGILLTLIGLLFSAFCFICIVLKPLTYNWLNIHFILSFAVMCVGLVICGWEAFHKKKQS